jgi:hypothetical protein
MPVYNAGVNIELALVNCSSSRKGGRFVKSFSRKLQVTLTLTYHQLEEEIILS